MRIRPLRSRDRRAPEPVTRALCCFALLVFAAGCGGTETVTVTVTNTVSVDNAAKQGLGRPGETVLFGYIKSLTKKGFLRAALRSFALPQRRDRQRGGCRGRNGGSWTSRCPTTSSSSTRAIAYLTYGVPADARLTVVALGPKNIPVTIEALAKIVAGDPDGALDADMRAASGLAKPAVRTPMTLSSTQTQCPAPKQTIARGATILSISP